MPPNSSPSQSGCCLEIHSQWLQHLMHCTPQNKFKNEETFEMNNNKKKLQEKLTFFSSELKFWEAYLLHVNCRERSQGREAWRGKLNGVQRLKELNKTCSENCITHYLMEFVWPCWGDGHKPERKVVPNPGHMVVLLMVHSAKKCTTNS